MERKKFNRAIEIMDEFRRLKCLQNDANHIIKCHDDKGICKDYWDDIADLMWKMKNLKRRQTQCCFVCLKNSKSKPW